MIKTERKSLRNHIKITNPFPKVFIWSRTLPSICLCCHWNFQNYKEPFCDSTLKPVWLNSEACLTIWEFFQIWDGKPVSYKSVPFPKLWEVFVFFSNCTTHTEHYFFKKHSYKFVCVIDRSVEWQCFLLIWYLCPVNHRLPWTKQIFSLQ